MRLKIVRVVMFFLLALVALDLVYIQGIQGPYFYNLSVNNRIRVIPLEGLRGLILDRNGTVLADNRLAFDVAVIPQDIADRETLFEFLKDILRVEEDILLKRFTERKITPFAPVVIAEDIDQQTAMKLEENKFRFPGLYIQENFRRLYPFKNSGAHVLGYLGKIDSSRIEKLKDYGYTYQSIIGYSGVEEYYDTYLRGKEGGEQIEVNSRGQLVRLLGTRDPEKGQDITLTIDQRIQDIASAALAEKQGCIIIMDLESGEILAMVSSPSYDPNVFIDTKLKDQAQPIFSAPSAPLLNRTIKGQYPPGSIAKVVFALAGLTTEKILPSTSFTCPGYYQLGRRQFRCSHQHGVQNLIEGIAHSCNVYFYNVGVLLGPDIMSKHLRIFGFGELTHVDLPFEEKGFVPSTTSRRRGSNKGWYKGDTLNFAIGQGDLLVTPIQVLRMMATVARFGNEVQPHLIKTIGKEEIIKLSTIRNIPIPENVFSVVRQGLRGAVADPAGTARLLNLPGLTVLGKTGTAQSVPGRDEHAWFAGFIPEGKKKIVFTVFLEYGGSSYNACVVAKDVLVRLKELEIL
jgi:penicillin-binding protein 2